MRKKICKTVWPKSMRGNERKGFRTRKGKLYMRIICLVCMAGTRAPFEIIGFNNYKKRSYELRVVFRFLRIELTVRNTSIIVTIV